MNKQEQQADEAAIMARVCAGDKDAYGGIVHRYEKALERYVRTLVAKSHDVDDIVQSVFIKAYVHAHTYDRRMKFSSWLYRIAHNESVNYIKSSFVQKVTTFGEWFEYGKADETEARIDAQILKKQLTTCLAVLDVKYKEPLMLFYLEEMSYEEISDILRIPVRAVGVRIHRAREQLRRYCYEKITR